MKHTKGEWKVGLQNPKLDFTEDNTVNINKKGIVKVYVDSDNHVGNKQTICLCGHESHDIVQANAKLIAAAPELLEALMNIVHLDDDMCKCPACKIGKQAIKKATE